MIVLSGALKVKSITRWLHPRQHCVLLLGCIPKAGQRFACRIFISYS